MFSRFRQTAAPMGRKCWTAVQHFLARVGSLWHVVVFTSSLGPARQFLLPGSSVRHTAKI